MKLKIANKFNKWKYPNNLQHYIQMKGKGKTHRKNALARSPKLPCKKMDGDGLKIKFNITQDNLCCFMGNKNLKKKGTRKHSQSVNKTTKGQELLKVQRVPWQGEIQQQRKIETSPDIPRELSNSILSHIENRGINYAWNEKQDRQQKQSFNDEDNQPIWSVFSNSFEKSYASTNDFPYYQNMSFYPYESAQLQHFKPIYLNNTVYTIVEYNITNDPRTTIMIRNIPNKYTIDDLSREIDSQHSNTYDFLYLPCDLKNQCNVGYGFINFMSTEHLRSFYCKFENYCWKKFKSQKICALTYARLQGLTQLIEHFENSKVFRDKRYRPIIKYDKVHQVVLAQQGKQLNF